LEKRIATSQSRPSLDQQGLEYEETSARNFFWVAYGNPIYIPVDYDYFVMAHFVPPVCAMKTRTDRYFYVPTVATDLLKIEMLFDDSGIEGDQTGGTTPYGSIVNYPDGIVDGVDLGLIGRNWGTSGIYITDLTGVTVAFDTGEVLSPNSYGYIPIPQDATSFHVTRYGNPIGAMIIFWP
jgi:hypothetical protein